MEISASNILDSIIYRANIFNYDNKFLAEIKERGLKLDLSKYPDDSKCQSATGATFLKQSSKDQINQILSLIAYREDNISELNSNGEEEGDETVNTDMNARSTVSKRITNVSISPVIKDARSTLMLLLDVVVQCKKQLDLT